MKKSETKAEKENQNDADAVTEHNTEENQNDRGDLQPEVRKSH